MSLDNCVLAFRPKLHWQLSGKILPLWPLLVTHILLSNSHKLVRSGGDDSHVPRVLKVAFGVPQEEGAKDRSVVHTAVDISRCRK